MLEFEDLTLIHMMGYHDGLDGNDRSYQDYFTKHPNSLAVYKSGFEEGCIEKTTKRTAIS